MASNSNMYRVGDFVYFEAFASAPFQIRRIDELTKTPQGAVEAKVACYYRRRDVSSALIQQAEKYYCLGGEESDDDEDYTPAKGSSQNGSSEAKQNGHVDENHAPKKRTSLNKQEKHHLQHRELFLSRQIETLPATHIRGKCTVSLFNDVEPLSTYLDKDDAFYYKLIYDPNQKTLQEDRGSLRIGSEYQSTIQPLLKKREDDPRLEQTVEQLVWSPSQSVHLSDKDTELFHLLAKSVGTFARAHDTAAVLRQGPHLIDAVTAASRDITRQHAFDLLHQTGYRLEEAVRMLVPGGQPVLCRDQLEEWSASEAALFEEGLEKYAKIFAHIQADCLPWKSHKALVEMYYLWKTTDRYVKRRRAKLSANEHRLKQVYIPHYAKTHASVFYANALANNNNSNSGGTSSGRGSAVANESKGCESCGASQSQQWYAWGTGTLLCKLCGNCWTYWKKYGGLKSTDSMNKERAELANHSSSTASTVNASAMHSNPSTLKPSSNNGPSVTPHVPSIATAAIAGANGNALRGGTQCQITPQYLRIARKLHPACLQPPKLARRPGKDVWHSGKENIAKGKDINAIIKELIEKAKPVLENPEEATKLLQRQDLNSRNFAEKKKAILAEMDRILALKKISLTDAVSTNGADLVAALGKKRPAEESPSISSAKKPAQENGAE